MTVVTWTGNRSKNDNTSELRFRSGAIVIHQGGVADLTTEEITSASDRYILTPGGVNPATAPVYRPVESDLATGSLFRVDGVDRTPLSAESGGLDETEVQDLIDATPTGETAKQSYPSRLTTMRSIARATEDAFAAKVTADMQAFIDWGVANNKPMYVGEISWPNASPWSIFNGVDDPSRWNALGASLIKMLVDSGAWVSFWQADEAIAYNSGSAYSPAYVPGGPHVMGPIARANEQSAVLEGVYVPANGARVGVGLSTPTQGFPEGGTGLTYGASNAREVYSYGFTGAMDQIYDAGRVNDNPYARKWNYGSEATYTYLGSRPNISFVRLPVRWERFQRTLGGALDTTELARLETAIAAADAAGIGIILDIHNSGTYFLDNGTAGVGKSVGGVDVTQAHFVDLWTRLSTLFKNDARVIAYDLMNEPSIGPGTSWIAGIQAAITAIRANGDTKVIVPPVNAAIDDFKSNLTPPYTDPANNLRYQGHYYMGQFPTLGFSYDAYNAAYAAQGWRGSFVKGGLAPPVAPPTNLSRQSNKDVLTSLIAAAEVAGIIPAHRQAYDDFNRADSTANLPAPWSTSYGGIGIESNKARPRATVVAANGTPEAVWETRTADCVVHAKVTLSSVRAFIGVSARNIYPSHLVLYLNKTGTQDRIVLSTNPSASALASKAAAGLTLGQTYDVQLWCYGSQITVYIDGVLIPELTTTLSAPNQAIYGRATAHGLYMICGADPYDDGGSRWDDFEVATSIPTAGIDTTDMATYTADRTVALSDANKIVEMNSASANNVILPTDAAVALPVKSTLEVVQLGAGLTKIQAAFGVTVRGPAAGSGMQYASARLIKRAANDWLARGDIAVVPAFDPSQLGAALKWWIKADGETPVADGSTILPAEQSGSGVTHTQATPALRPLYKLNRLNGLPSYLFDGATTLFTLSSLAALTEGHLFMVVKATADPHSPGSKSGSWHFGSEPTNGSLYPFTDGSIYEDFGSTVRKTVGNPTPSLAAFRLYEVVSTASEFTVYLDGTQLFTTATNTVGFAAAPTVGKSLGSFWLDGEIQEACLLNAKATAPQRANMKSYVTSKHALTIA